MGDQETPGTAIKAPEQAVPPAAPPADPPAPAAEPAQAPQKDVDDMSDAEFEAFDKAMEQSAGEPEPQAAETKKDAAPEPKPGETKKEDGAPPAADVETMKAELEKLRQENQIAREFQENPAAAAKKYPDIAKRIVDSQRAAEAEARSGKRPEWAYVPVEQLTVPNNPGYWGTFANWPVAELAKKVEVGEMDAGVYQKIVTRLAQMQGEQRGKYEATQNLERRAFQDQQQAAWKELAIELQAENPTLTPEQIQAVGRQVVEFMSTRTPHPRDVYRLMKFDEHIAAAEKRGEERGRQAVVKDLEAAGRAPSGVTPAREGSGGEASLLDQFKAMNPQQRARAMDDWSDAQIADLEKEAKARGFNLDAL